MFGRFQFLLWLRRLGVLQHGWIAGRGDGRRRVIGMEDRPSTDFGKPLIVRDFQILAYLGSVQPSLSGLCRFGLDTRQLLPGYSQPRLTALVSTSLPADYLRW